MSPCGKKFGSLHSICHSFAGTDDERSCVASNGSLESSRARRRQGLGGARAMKMMKAYAFKLLTNTTLILKLLS